MFSVTKSENMLFPVNFGKKGKNQLQIFTEKKHEHFRYELVIEAKPHIFHNYEEISTKTTLDLIRIFFALGHKKNVLYCEKMRFKFGISFNKNIFFYFPLGDGIALSPEKFKRKSFKKTLKMFDLEQTICLQTGVVVLIG